MRTSTIDKLQNKLDDLRFKKRYNETFPFQPILFEKENEGYYQKDSRRRMQLKIDYLNEIQKQIEELKKSQDELTKEFYQEYDHHFDLSQSI